MRRPVVPCEIAAMKVVHALGWYFPESLGGTEIYVSAVTRCLRGAGVDTLVAAPRAGATGVDEYTHEGTPVFRYSTPVDPTRAEARGEQVVRGAELLHRWLERQRPDVVHFHTFVTGLDFEEVRAARMAGARVVVTTHASALGYLCLRGTLRRWGQEWCDGVIRSRTCAACVLHAHGVPRSIALAVSAIPPALARRLDGVEHAAGTALGLPAYIARREQRQHQLFDLIDRFFVLTERARATLLANGAPPERVVVNRLGIDASVLPPRTKPRASHTPLTVGFLGRFDPLKGVDDLLDAIALIPPSIPVRFDIRGIADQDASTAIVARARQLAAADGRVTLGGAVARAHVGAVLAGWDVLCCPGRSLEGGPTVALEAIAVGTPVIATNVGGVAEVLHDGRNCALVPPADAAALARAIEQVATNREVLPAWRSALPAVRTMDDVTHDYLRAYGVGSGADTWGQAYPAVAAARAT
jgi:glycosyltransferase involved in cell wall biosynthesis